ncbi:sigma factor-like helix-turn-helix DNA-binding protein [Bacteroides sp.]|uniref:sigma factor-like helix-turn-helix DNA-binding protein n=1 Tax=Bacteroides sp. TaxID=29523 RepID=UPI0026368BAC|nr:sigma factor-like helix-turn-helix DNA-binding protein [Bacteroides sp.]MDD3040623.1 sigma factor-like helix-turn-helix DNA-binding protein [Bacteroides sp.]
MKKTVFCSTLAQEVVTFQDLIKVLEGIREELPNDCNARNSMIRKVNKKEKSVSYQVPSAKALREAGIPMLMKEDITEDTRVTVFANGYVEYRQASHKTIFSVDDCRGDYTDSSEVSVSGVIAAESFRQEKWYFRLILEGEQKISHNTQAAEKKRQISYDVDYAEEGIMLDPAIQTIERLCNKEAMVDYLSCLTERQKEIVYRHFVLEQTKTEISKALVISQAAVTDALKHAFKRIRKNYFTTT